MAHNSWSRASKGRGGLAIGWLGIFLTALAVLLYADPVSAQQVAIEKTGFNNLPDKSFYFKDSNVRFVWYVVCFFG